MSNLIYWVGGRHGNISRKGAQKFEISAHLFMLGAPLFLRIPRSTNKIALFGPENEEGPGTNFPVGFRFGSLQIYPGPAVPGACEIASFGPR